MMVAPVRPDRALKFGSATTAQRMIRLYVPELPGQWRSMKIVPAKGMLLGGFLRPPMLIYTFW